MRLLLNSLLAAGGTIKQPGYTQFKGEVEYHLMEAPINWARAWLKNMGHRAATAQAARRRRHLEGAADFDADMHRKLQNARPDEQRRQLLMVQSGAVWTASTLHKAGYLQSDVCSSCGKAAETLKHLWWDCPEHEHHRKRIRTLVPDGPDCLPPCLAHFGIPVEPSADLQGRMWKQGKELGTEAKLTPMQTEAWTAVADEWVQQAPHAGVHILSELAVCQLALRTTATSSHFLTGSFET